MISIILACCGTWIISDGAYSITLYLGSKSYRGDPQNWVKDHSVRLLRIILGVCIIICGVIIND
jgi:hypothetical protein